MKAITSLFFICIMFFANAEDKPILVSASWVKENLKSPNLVILQPNFMKVDYEREHIEGARFVWPAWLNPDSPEGSMNVPDINSATDVLRNLGVSENSHIILCHVRNEVSITTRLFIILEHLGLRGKVSLLNGGLEAWKKEGYPITKEVPSVKKGNVKLKPGSLLVDKEYVLKTLRSSSAYVVDARVQRFYDGEPTGNPRDGHIAGAKNIAFTEMVDANNMFKSNDELSTYFSPVASKDKELVAYCFIGQTATVLYFAGRLLGYDMKVYDGSMQEWSRLEELPMEKTPKNN
jgi:thiosulfate/3-mercaptopyruvate sulfurtransferase